MSDVSLRAIEDAAALAPEDLHAYMETKITSVCAALLVTYFVLSALCFAMVIYLRRNRTGALHGDSSAARKLILPAFEPLLWILGGATGAYSVYFATTLVTHSFPPEMPSIPSESFYAGRQFVLLLVIVFMLQKSVTLPALRRAVAITLVLSVYTIPVAWYIVGHNDAADRARNFWLLTVAHTLMLPLFAYVMVWPPGRASKSSLRLYCVFGIVQHLLQLACNAAFDQLEVDLMFSLMYVQLALSSMCPFFIWRVLKDDTEHWRGLGQRACALQSLFRQRLNVNERISSQGLHVLIEMHRKYIIDFAYLELRQRIGVGSSAVVYNGVLNSKTPVAIKVYTPRSVTEDTVAAFSHEAALCGALNHPNIVKFYGMCVSPPTICLVSELCQGSLDLVTQQLAKRSHDTRRQQFLINIGYMLDAARAVAYIHSFSPAFVHRDIKPGNFLVDADGTVKLTDFGESRSLPQSAKSSGSGGSASTNDSDDFATTDSTTKTRESAVHVSVSDSREVAASDGLVYVDYDRVRKSEIKTLASETAATSDADAAQMTVKGTVDYMAPEMINGRGGLAAYGEAADVYSLAITMWDILHPGCEKYPSSKSNHLRVFETVIAGSRPELDRSAYPSSLCDLLAASWHQDFWRRPSAQTIVHALERIQEDASASFALELSDDLQHDAALLKVDDVLVRTTTGELAVQRMKALGAVATISEGVRLGNMLMNAGFVHHTKHARAFEFAADATYYFDEPNVRLCQPFAMLEVREPSHVDDHDSDYSASWRGAALPPAGPAAGAVGGTKPPPHHFHPSDLAGLESGAYHDGSSGDASASVSCDCRRLGQRLVAQKPVKRLLFQRKHQPIPEDAALTAALLAQDTRNVAFYRTSGHAHASGNVSPHRTAI